MTSEKRPTPQQAAPTNSELDIDEITGCSPGCHPTTLVLGRELRRKLGRPVGSTFEVHADTCPLAGAVDRPSWQSAGVSFSIRSGGGR